MSQINAYLSFEGNCREAFTFYQECLGAGAELRLQTVGDTPMAADFPPAKHGLIMHAELKKGDMRLLGSDMEPDDGLIKGNVINLMLYCDTEAEIRSYFDKLSAGGRIKLPLADQFWGSIFGDLYDKFGMHWMLNYDKPKA